MRYGDRSGKSKEDVSRLVTHGLFAATEHHVDLYFVTLEHKLFGLSFLEEEVMLLGTIAEAHALGLDFLLLGFGGLGLLGGVILKLPVIRETTHRGDGLRGHLDEVKFAFFGNDHTLGWTHGAKWFAGFANHHYLWSQDLLIDAVTLLNNNFRLRSIVASASHVRTYNL